MHRRATPRARLLRRAPLAVAAAFAPALLGDLSAEASTPLLWPTSAGTCLTSTFGEFREAHFHSGVDVSTSGKIGFPVYAVAGGEIARVRQSCRGYGKAIYLRLDDGNTAVYAHLSEFGGALAESVRAIQRRAGDAHFDHTFPSGIRVKRGETIGKTGQSGAGPPHLHFEVRDAQERALDPLAHGLRAPDSDPPRIVRIALTPLTPNSSVDGDSRSVIVRAVPRKDGSFVAERAVPVSGRIGISVEAKDGIDACDRGMAPKRWELARDGATLFAVDCDRFTFDEWGQSDLQFDSRWSYSGGGDFVNLWRRPGNAFPSSAGDWPAYDGVEAPGAKDEPVTYAIAAIDASGNRAYAALTLSPAETKPGEASREANGGAGNGTAPNGDAANSGAPIVETRGGWVEARFPALPPGTRVELAGAAPEGLTIFPIEDGGTRLAFVPEGRTPTTVRVAFPSAAGSDLIDVVFPGLTARANQSGSAASADSAAIVHFPERVLREDTIVVIRPHASMPYADELRLIGTLYEIDTGSVPLAGEYDITMRQPADFAEDPDHVGVFVHSGEGFRYIGGANARGAFVGSTQRPRPFGLFEDRRPPAIARPRFTRKSGRWRVELTVRDRGAGIDCDDLSVSLDGVRLLTEYDGETGEVVALLDEPPAPGERAVRVTARDRLGNRSERTDTLKALAK